MIPPFPSWARPRGLPKNPEETGFLAGAALAALGQVRFLLDNLAGVPPFDDLI